MTDPASPAVPKPAELTSRLAVQPGLLIRGVPGFLFSVPRGWLLDEAPDSLAVVRTPEEIDDFWPNAIISHDRVARAVDFETAAKATWARLQQASPDAKVSFEKMARFGTNVVYLRGAEMKAPKSGRDIGQLQAMFFAPAPDEGKTVDFFQIVATAPAELMEQFAAPFLEIIGSFRFS